MSIPVYSILIWNNVERRVRMIVCEDADDVADWCKAGFGPEVEPLSSRDQVLARCRESGWKTWLILDGKLAEEEELTGRRTVYEVSKWCDIEPRLSTQERAQQVVVWSGSHSTTKEFFRWYVKTANPVEDLQLIRLWCEEAATGKLTPDAWPLSLLGRSETLSQVIHGLHNVFLPVGLDVSTLADIEEHLSGAAVVIGENCRVVEDVFRDHFGKQGESYLGDKSRQHDGLDILAYIDKLCNSLPEDVKSKIETKRQAVGLAVGKARLITKQDSLKRPGQIDCSFVEQLKNVLKEVSDKGNELVSALREIRKGSESGQT